MDDIFFALIIIANFVCGYLLGWKMREMLAIRRMNDHFITAQEKLKQLHEKDIVDITIEKHDGTLFVYNKRTSEYMAHGETQEKLEKMLAEKYPGKMFNASTEDMEKMHSESV